MCAQMTAAGRSTIDSMSIYYIYIYIYIYIYMDRIGMSIAKNSKKHLLMTPMYGSLAMKVTITHMRITCMSSTCI